MCMAKKPHSLIVRVTERQLRFLTDIMVEENRCKSEVLRTAINQYLIENSTKHANSEPAQEKPRKVK